MTNNIPTGALEIRPASFNDIAAIQEIAGKTWPFAYEKILGNKQLEYMLGLFYSSPALHEQMSNKQYFFLALIDFEPVGFMSLSKLDDKKYKLHKLYVLPGLQKQGTGRKLLETAETIAKSMGAKKLSLNVNRQNQAAHFYQKAGFSITATEDIDIGNGYYMNDYIMEKDL